jgi:hypothetical protein
MTVDLKKILYRTTDKKIRLTSQGCGLGVLVTTDFVGADRERPIILFLFMVRVHKSCTPYYSLHL